MVKKAIPDFRCSDAVRVLIDQGKKGNGCGAFGTSKIIVFFITCSFGFDFSRPCNTHDLEYGLPKEMKSFSHRQTADDDFEYNLKLEVAFQEITGYRKWLYHYLKLYRALYDNYKENAPRYYHAAVTARGHDAYWG